MLGCMFVERATTGVELMLAKTIMRVVVSHKMSADTSLTVTCIFHFKLRDDPFYTIVGRKAFLA